MAFSLTWLPDVLNDAGLKVARVSGWKNRGVGNSDIKDIQGILCHHTVGPPTGNMPSLNVLRDGRANLRGPLSQLGLGRDGTYYLIAAGKANHAAYFPCNSKTTFPAFSACRNLKNVCEVYLIYRSLDALPVIRLAHAQ